LIVGDLSRFEHLIMQFC